MMSLPERLRSEWIRAAGAIGIAVVAPYELCDASGVLHCFACLLPQFGSARGMLILAEYDRRAADAARSAGFGFAVLEPRSDEETAEDVESAMDCLLDWGWTSPEPPPDWYSGASQGRDQ